MADFVLSNVYMNGVFHEYEGKMDAFGGALDVTAYDKNGNGRIDSILVKESFASRFRELHGDELKNYTAQLQPRITQFRADLPPTLRAIKKAMQYEKPEAINGNNCPMAALRKRNTEVLDLDGDGSVDLVRYTTADAVEVSITAGIDPSRRRGKCVPSDLSRRGVAEYLPLLDGLPLNPSLNPPRSFGMPLPPLDDFRLDPSWDFKVPFPSLPIPQIEPPPATIPEQDDFEEKYPKSC